MRSGGQGRLALRLHRLCHRYPALCLWSWRWRRRSGEGDGLLDDASVILIHNIVSLATWPASRLCSNNLKMFEVLTFIAESHRRFFPSMTDRSPNGYMSSRDCAPTPIHRPEIPSTTGTAQHTVEQQPHVATRMRLPFRTANRTQWTLSLIHI